MITLDRDSKSLVTGHGHQSPATLSFGGRHQGKLSWILPSSTLRVKTMQRAKDSDLAEQFHDIMLSLTASGSRDHGPSISRGGGPSVFQGASPPRQSLPNQGNQPTARPYRPAFGSSDKGTNAELKEVRSCAQKSSSSE